MKRKIGAIVTVLFIINLSIIKSNAYSKEVSIATINFEPYYGEKMQNDGFIAEIVREALKSIGLSCCLKYYPWARAVKTVQSGKAEILMTLWYRKDREKYFYYSSPLPSNKIVFYRKIGTFHTFNGWESLKKYTIGGVRDYTYPEQFKSLDMQYTRNDVLNMKKLGAGRIDLIIIDEAQAKYHLDTQLSDLISKIEAIDPPIEVKHQYLGISKQIKNPGKLLSDFNTGLVRITESGLLKKIRDKHGY